MDVRTKNPYAGNLDQDGIALVQKFVERHGIVLDPQDPILVIQTMNAHLINKAAQQLQAAARTSLAEITASQQAILAKHRALVAKDAANLTEGIGNELHGIPEHIARAVEAEISRLLSDHAETVYEHIGRILDDRDQKQRRVMTYGWLGTACLVIAFALLLVYGQ